MFVDASAIVAILTREREADAFAEAIEASGTALTSPIAVFEAALGLSRTRHVSIEEATADVEEFLRIAGVHCVPISVEDGRTALVAFARYGKGRGHPARLNLGDCFAYAMARNRAVPLLFKGNDFSNTDIEAAA